MSNDTLAKISATKAAEVCRHFPLGEEAKKLLRNGLTPRQFLDLLVEKQLYQDATRFLAHALPKREAVWWACVCVRRVSGPDLPPSTTVALQAASAWVVDPTADNRRAAMQAAEAAGFGTPAGCAGAAAFWSGGSVGPPNVPAIPPGEALTAQGVTGALLLAAVQAEPAKAPEKYRKFLAQGIEVAQGASRWK